jgi:two-component system, LytTR family, sensor kinase
MPASTTPKSHPAALVPVVTSRQRYLRQLWFSVLFWTGIILLESIQVFVADVPWGRALPASHYLVWATFNWFVMMPLTPLIYQLGERYPIVGTRWTARLVSIHVFACAVCLLAQAFGRGIAGWLYTRHHELPAPPLVLTGEWIEMRGILCAIAYWTIVLAAGLAQLREEYRQREIRQAQIEASLASADLEKLRTQLQPHFLFNTLQAAITLVQEDPQAAEDVLLRLSQLLRIALDEMEADEIPLSRELEILDLYVGIQQRRFGERLAVEIHAESATLDMAVPPLILQPLVENAIRHGIGKHKGQDCIEIFARREDAGLQIEVWNGNSVVEETGVSLFRRGVGLRNTKARLEHSYGPGASFLFRPLARGGAMAMIFIPVQGGRKPQLRPASQRVL